MALATTTYFPSFGLSLFRTQRGQRWADLVDWVAKLPMSDPQVMAMTRTVRQVQRTSDVETSCHEPFCAICASQVIGAFRGSEQELIELYQHNLDTMRTAIAGMRVRETVHMANVVTAVA